MRESVDAYRPFFDRAQVEVDVDLPGQSLRVSSDRDDVTQALASLLHNAREYGA